MRGFGPQRSKKMSLHELFTMWHLEGGGSNFGSVEFGMLYRWMDK